MGTGFLIHVDKIYYLATAKHIIEEFAKTHGNDNALAYFLNMKDGKSSYGVFTELKRNHNINWIMSQDADIAVIPFPIGKEYDVIAISDELFLTSNKIIELQDVFFVSYQPGIESKEKITPITRKGMISVINDDGSFYLDGFAFPGNSGSPVFILPVGMTFTPTGLYAGDPLACRFVGLI